jgi:NADH-quinone oxidoreductase subunit L
MDSTGTVLRNLLTVAWLLPLVGFVIELYALQLRWSHRLSKAPAYVAVACIGIGFLCSAAALWYWGEHTQWAALQAPSDHGHHDSHGDAPSAANAHAPAAGDAPRARHAESRAEEHTAHADNHEQPADALAATQPAPAADAAHAAAAEPGHATATQPGHPEAGKPAHAAAAHDAHAAATESAHGHPPAEHRAAPAVYAGAFYRLARFGTLEVSLDYYIDSLTLVMFVMVTLIATCIHVFAIGYMSDELTEEYVDHEVHLPDGQHLHRPGRFHRFFAFLSLFSFSMLGLVLAGNIFQVFIFWELVGICSYLLIGFYVERKSASTAANKAFIMNRVGDFGFIIGLMIIWTAFGTFRFFDADGGQGRAVPGLFTMVRGHDGSMDVAQDGRTVYFRDAQGQRLQDGGQPRSMPYGLLIAAGLGVFAGCIGKSAQFPLQTWLPDAMEGPTPVSALVHSATMVAAGVYLAGRFYPVFTPEVLLAIAYVGCITLFVAATIAIVATDIKRVLAYSTISQLGYMMLGLGVAGWGAGLFHLVTHAFFKSLMFLASGSVIAGCHHVQEMTRMGGLRRKMPWTAYTMLVGVIAIAGLAVPGIKPFGQPLAFSGYHSKDAIVASALAYSELNAAHSLLFIVPLVTAGITAFYMFRLWFMTFAGSPRDAHVYDHARENGWVMVGPLVVLSFFAAFVAWSGEEGPLYRLIAASETVPAHASAAYHRVVSVVLPGHQQVHEVHAQAGGLALLSALLGTALAYALYCRRVLNPDDIRRQLAGLYDFLADKWRFDALYDAMFVRPTHIVARWCQGFDKHVLDRMLDGSATWTVAVSRWDRWFDENFVDGLVNLVGNATYAVGASLRAVQTGRLRQYVMWIAVAVVALFAALFIALPK